MTARLSYLTNTSLDGYIEDATGDFGFSEPDDEVHGFVNDLVRPVGTHLYGRRLYETMAVWETDPSLAEGSDVMRDFAQLWQAADKVVFSRSLDRTTTARTRLERNFDPEAIRAMKAAATADMIIGGAELAGQALRAGVVDECGLLVHPVVVGGGKRALPDDLRADLELLDERRFAAGGVVYLRYRVGRRT